VILAAEIPWKILHYLLLRECDAPKPEVKPRYNVIIDPACHSPLPMVHFVIRSGVVLTAADPNGRKWPRTLFSPEDTP
jgi:hypothetical protein